MLLQVGADHAKTADDLRRPGAHILLSGNIVEEDPTILACNHALGTKHRTELTGIQFLQNSRNLRLGINTGRFLTPAGKHLIGMMVMIVAPAGTLFPMLMVMMLMFMMMLMMMLMFVVVIVLMIMTTAITMLVVMMFVFMLMVVIVTPAGALLIVVMMMVMLMMMLQLMQDLLQSILLFHSIQHLLAVQLIPGSSDDRGIGVLFLDQGYCLCQLLLAQILGATENDASGMLQLIIVEFTKILGIDLALGRIGNGSKAVQLYPFQLQIGHSGDHIAELTDTAGLDQHPIGMIGIDHLLQRLPEITHQTAADTAGIHFGDLDPCLLQEATVDADLTELVFDENQLFSFLCFLHQFLDEGGFTGS